MKDETERNVAVGMTAIRSSENDRYGAMKKIVAENGRDQRRHQTRAHPTEAPGARPSRRRRTWPRASAARWARSHRSPEMQQRLPEWQYRSS